MQDLKMTDHQNPVGWKCRTWNWRTKLQHMKVTDHFAGHENAKYEITGHEKAHTHTLRFNGHFSKW